LKNRMTTIICNRCGDEFLSPVVTLRTIMKLSKANPAERAKIIASEESVSIELAQSWLHHNMNPTCQKKVAHCSKCGGELRTWMARWCPHCNHDWHNA
jgi:DNA-directed RNA polymerase subunit RPC12/RpoP